PGVARSREWTWQSGGTAADRSVAARETSKRKARCLRRLLRHACLRANRRCPGQDGRWHRLLQRLDFVLVAEGPGSSRRDIDRQLPDSVGSDSANDAEG